MKRILFTILFFCFASMAYSSGKHRTYIFENYDLDKVLHDEYNPKQDILKVFNLPYEKVIERALEFAKIYNLDYVEDTTLPRLITRYSHEMLYKSKGEITFLMGVSNEFIKNTNYYYGNFDITLIPIQNKEQTAVLVRPIAVSYIERYQELTTVKIPGEPQECHTVVLPPVPQIGAYAGISVPKCDPDTGTPDTYTQKYLWKERDATKKASRNMQKLIAIKMFRVIQEN